jgi:hypothetical protein
MTTSDLHFHVSFATSGRRRGSRYDVQCVLMRHGDDVLASLRPQSRQEASSARNFPATTYCAIQYKRQIGTCHLSDLVVRGVPLPDRMPARHEPTDRSGIELWIEII